MVALYYEVFFGISFLLTIVYVLIWRRYFDINITILFILIPIVNLGHVLFASSKNSSSAIDSLKITHIGSCFLTFFITMCVLNLCEIKISRLTRMIAFFVSTVLYIFVLTMDKNKLFYKSVVVINKGNVVEVQKEYGPIHNLLYAVICVYFVVSLVAIIYTILRNNQVSNTISRLLFLPEFVSVFGYFGNKIIGGKVEIMPVTYIFAQIVYIMIVRRLSLYSVSEMVIESMVETGETGFITVDFRHHYLGSNETAKNILPGLRNIAIDENVLSKPWLENTVCHWIMHFEKDHEKKHLFTKKNSVDKAYINKNVDPDAITAIEESDNTYIVRVQYLYDGKRKCGYQIFLDDDTQNQKYIALLDRYKTELEEEVKIKTQHIVEMHDNLILSMATMVESRDNSTGGHIKRTSKCVEFLVDEMKKDEEFELRDMLTDEFCKDIIKAAPMHDLGKVAVDDAILRKPGRFTPEEFNIMKSHAAEGARIVHEILKDTDDESFKIVAENVAHYHHERMDGSGYPEGLVGEEIPLEARIMAIADVYDALVSKRIYKESMSFEAADAIMLESMGKHFDKRLEKYYINARPRLEEYYESQGDAYIVQV